jgi:hypothetical protein
MSRDAVWGFTEGYTDRYIYDNLAREICRRHDFSITIATADEIPDGGRGKVGLLEFFDYAKRNNLLAGSFKGKTTVCLFFLDKDLDDVRRRKRRSLHVLYTDTYEAENLLFLHGDLAKAAGAAAFLNCNVFGQRFSDQRRWCAQAARCWQEWVTLCVFSVLKAENPRGFYQRSQSQINPSAYETTNHVAFRNEVISLEGDWLDPNTSFDKAFGLVEKLVRRAYDDGEPDRFFRGKWYTHFLYADVQQLARNRQWNRNGFHDRVLSCLAMSFNTQCGWARRLSKQIEGLLRLV